jgi:pimeloyl-ACP methyl ester carboxylesterase
MRDSVGYLSRRFAPLLKILADVFRYLGDSSYRTAVQAEFASQLRELAQLGSKNLFIFAHSLGTVIAVDSLRRLYSEGFDSIVLVTAGSPLRRFFWRFFQLDYPEPWALLVQVSRILGKNNTRFSWFNVFRRKDPVGGLLRLPPGHECAVPKANETVLSAHLDYWTDEEVHRAIIRFLK